MGSSLRNSPGSVLDLLRPPFFQTPTHARKTQERHRRNTPEKRNTPETQEGDGRTNGRTCQSYGRNTKETREGHAGNPALSAERGRGARPRSYTRVSGDPLKLHACTWEGCLDARAAVVAPALGFVLFLFLLCSLFLPVSSLLFRLLQCLQLSPCTRFPFYDTLPGLCFDLKPLPRRS